MKTSPLIMVSMRSLVRKSVVLLSQQTVKGHKKQSIIVLKMKACDSYLTLNRPQKFILLD